MGLIQGLRNLGIEGIVSILILLFNPSIWRYALERVGVEN
jgi:hypothetical protein